MYIYMGVRIVAPFIYQNKKIVSFIYFMFIKGGLPYT